MYYFINWEDSKSYTLNDLIGESIIIENIVPYGDNDTVITFKFI